MIGDYRFGRVLPGGALVFAHVIARSEPSTASGIEWAPDVNIETARAKTGWGADIERGVAQAIDAHVARGGTPHTTTILSAAYLPADTTDDQMTCAAAIATWKSLGHDEEAARIEREGKLWRVIF